MAYKKKPYNWSSVKPGDIVSFRYKSKYTDKSSTNSILVLNPKFRVALKDGKMTHHLIGIKLEQSNKIQLRLTRRQLTLLEQIGKLKTLDDDNNLYRLEIDKKFIDEFISKILPDDSAGLLYVSLLPSIKLSNLSKSNSSTSAEPES